MRDGGVLLHRQMRAALKEEKIFPHQIGRGNSRRRVAELEVDEFVEVAAVAIVVDLWLGMRDSFLRGVERLERRIDHLDEIERRGRRFFGRCRHRRHGIADEANFVEAQRMLVLRDGQNAEWNRQIPADEDGQHASQPLRRGDIDRDDARVRLGAAQQLAVQHAGEGEIVGKARRPRHLGDGIDFTEGFTDDAVFAHTRPMRAAASSTAS